MAHNPYVELIKDYKTLIYSYQDADKAGTPVFPPGRRLLVDLGCGSGNFCVKYAELYPDTDVIGIEVRYKRLVKGAQKTLSRNLSNVRFIQCRVENFNSWIGEYTADEICSNFPDPWPKKRHHKHRFLNPNVFANVHRALKTDGIFRFKTDYEEYFYEVRDFLMATGLFRIADYTENYKHSEFFRPELTSEFEMLFHVKKQRVYYLSGVKI